MNTQIELRIIMLPDMSAIVQQWDDCGIIIETQFLCASQAIIARSNTLLYELIVENGGHKAVDNDGSNEQPTWIAAADFIEDEGFMYYLYDLSILDQKAATHAVKMYFSEQRSATSCPDKAPK